MKRARMASLGLWFTLVGLNGCVDPSYRVDRSAVRIVPDLAYGSDSERQTLDLYLPDGPGADLSAKESTVAQRAALPLVVYIHGDGWRRGDKSQADKLVGPLLESGELAVASINYRLSQEAIWPAQLHDCKAAIRYLRANAAAYNIDPQRIAVMGVSAGGHLSALLATTRNDAGLEGTVGPHLEISSSVNSAIVMCGPANLNTMPGALQAGEARSVLAQLLGAPPDERPDLAAAASPVTYASSDDAPMLLVHGTQDRLVPLSQAEALNDKLRTLNVRSSLTAVEGAGHLNFFTNEAAERVDLFLRSELLGETADLDNVMVPLR